MGDSRNFSLFNMRVVAAYMLAVLGGNTTPSVEDVKAILSSVGIEAEEEQLTRFFKEIEGKDIEEVIAAGEEKLAKFGGAAGPAAGGEAAAEEKEEEKVEEEEADLGGGMDM